MYGLVQGKESIPFRKAQAVAPVTNISNGASDEGDEAPLSFSILQRAGVPRWLVPVAGILLVAGLILALVKLMPGTPHGRQRKPDAELAEATPAKAKDKAGDETSKDKAAPQEALAANVKPADGATLEKKSETAVVEAPSKDPARAATTPPQTTQTTQPTAPATPPATAQSTPPPPETGRREVGTYTAAARNGPTLLVQRQDDQLPWRRLTPGGRVYSADPLVSLPGSLSEVRLDKGVRLQMRGMIPEFASDPMMTQLLDSAVVLHPNKDVDLDFTLSRGRVYLANEKDSGPARVRIRIDREVWDLTLAAPESEAIVEVIKRYNGDIRWQEGEEPWTGVYLAIIKGKGALNADFHDFPNLEMPGPSFFVWDNKGKRLSGPNKLQKPFSQWDKSPPANRDADEMTAALEDLSKRLTDKKGVEVVLMEGLQSDKLPQRLVSIYALCALDEVHRLLDVLNDEDPTHGPERIKTVSMLRLWISRGPEMGRRLYDPQKRAGILTKDIKATPGEAETILKMLYGFNEAERRSADTYRVLADYLLNSKIAIRELAIEDLYQLGAPIRFNPAWPDAERQKAHAEVYKLVEDHKLPPPLRDAGAPPGAGGGGR
jgi:hypothetical protein